MSSLSEALQTISAVIITGGSSGIGKSFIELIAKLKPKLVICNLSRRPPQKNISPDDGVILNHFGCDLSRADDLVRAAEEVTAFLEGRVPTGGILLINNSGIGAFGRFPEPNVARQLEMIDLNVRAVVHLTGLLLPLLRSRGGVIMNIASTVAFQPTPFAATYGASKAFVLHWSLALNEELRGSGLRAMAVCPGTTTTEFFHNAGVGPGATLASMSMTSDDVAERALRAMAEGQPMEVPGWKNKVYTFFGSKLPKPLVTRIAARVLASIRLKRPAP